MVFFNNILIFFFFPLSLPIQGYRPRCQLCSKGSLHEWRPPFMPDYFPRSQRTPSRSRCSTLSMLWRLVQLSTRPQGHRSFQLGGCKGSIEGIQRRFLMIVCYYFFFIRFIYFCYRVLLEMEILLFVSRMRFSTTLHTLSPPRLSATTFWSPSARRRSNARDNT